MLLDENVRLGILTLGSEHVNLSDFNAFSDKIGESNLLLLPPIMITEAVNYLHSITYHLQSLLVSILSRQAGHTISIPTSTVVSTTTYLALALSLYVQSYMFLLYTSA